MMEFQYLRQGAMNKILKDPLVHFLAVGLGFFALFEFVSDNETAYDSRVINVDRDSLLTFIQFRMTAFEPAAAAASLDAMSDEELGLLIDDYVREEALHREALALGMDKNDYVIKRRLIQSIEFITSGFVTAAVEVSSENISAHYDANRADYYVEPYVTFTHVYFGYDRRSREETAELADAKLAELNAAQVPFTDAPQHGDRFHYLLNYVESNPEFITSHFGARMAEAIFELAPDELTWRGPLESPYGLHLVMLTKKKSGRYPELTEIAETVRQDAERAATSEMQDQAIQAIVDTYEIRRTL